MITINNLKEKILKLKERIQNEINRKKFNLKSNFSLHERSENVVLDNKLTSFLYQLMRDHLPAGTVEEIVRQSEGNVKTYYTNGWLAKYAEDLTNRLK